MQTLTKADLMADDQDALEDGDTQVSESPNLTETKAITSDATAVPASAPKPEADIDAPPQASTEDAPAPEQPMPENLEPASDANTAPDDALAAAQAVPEQAPPSVFALPDLDTSDIHAEWLSADLRALRHGDFAENQPQVEALLQRLQALRNRVGDLGRVPRR
jgi:hypothetical protein